jgi:hypothetical protein
MTIPTKVYTDLEWTNSGTNDYVESAAGQFVIDGWVVGRKVKVTGASVALNNATWNIKTVTATRITFTSVTTITTDSDAGINVTFTTYRETLTRLPVSGVEVDESIALVLADGDVSIDNYCSVANVPGVSTIPAGLFEMHGWFWVETGFPEVTTAKFTVRTVTTAGVITEHGTSSAVTITGTLKATATMLTMTFINPTDIAINSTDRLIVRVQFNAGDATSRVAHFLYQGTTRAAFIDTPFNVTAPKGDTGIQGDTGVGIQGDSGVDGDQGDTGVGSQGDTGVGVQGDTGIGVQGDTGVGSQGDTGVGTQGDTGIGIQGDSGVDGDQGDTGVGSQGDTGVGVQGDTGIGIQGDTGVGTQGDTGVGDTGIQGDTGVGTQGDTPAGFVNLTASGLMPTITTGCAPTQKIETTNGVNYLVLDFDDGGNNDYEYAEVTIPMMPSDYDGGDLQAAFIWLTSGVGTDRVVWGIQARGYADGDAIDAAWSGGQTVIDNGNGTAYDVLISSFCTAFTPIGSPAANRPMQFRVFRHGANASDDLSGDARLIGVAVKFTRV